MKALKNNSQFNCLFASAIRLASACLAIVSAVAVFRPAHAVQIAVGSYNGTGVAGLAITGVGFRPDGVILKRDNDQPTVVRTSTMSGDASKQLTSANALQPNRIQSLDIDGFTVGDDPEVNGTRAYYWIAFNDDGLGDFKVGSYTGDNTDNRLITGVGFRPDYIIVMSSQAQQAVHRSSAMPGDSTLFFHANAAASNLIQDLKTNGFQVGNDNNVNGAGIQYHYVAWRGRRMAVGSYEGDGTAGRSINGVGYQPIYVIIKMLQSAQQGVHRPASLPGDQTLKFNGGMISGAITSLQPDGFQIGAADAVNLLARTFYWMAFTTVDLPTPTIDKLSPSTGPPGTSVTITGWSFGDTPGALTFNGAVITPTSWSNTTIVFTIPEGATTGAVQVAVGGRTSQPAGFVVAYPAASIFYFYDALNRLKAVVDAAGGTAIYNYDAVGNLLSITRQDSPQVSVFGFTPKNGPSGTSVTIYGANFSPNPDDNTVKINGVAAYVNAASSTEASIIVPPSFTVCGTISVATALSSATSQDSFCP
jgi:YD repeat-containing protein